MATRVGPERGNGGGSAPAPVTRASRVAFHAKRIGLLFGLAIGTYLLFPVGAAVDSPIFEVGSVATRDVIAPFAFAVPKPPADLARERDDAARTVSVILVYDATALDSADRVLDKLMDSLNAAAAQTPGGAEAIQRA